MSAFEVRYEFEFGDLNLCNVCDKVDEERGKCGPERFISPSQHNLRDVFVQLSRLIHFSYLTGSFIVVVAFFSVQYHTE